MYKKRVTLDMTAVKGKGVNEFKDSLIQNEFLPVSAIFGPNGGGKTTLLRAFYTIQFLIARHFSTVGGIASDRLMSQLIIEPFRFDEISATKPTSFEIMLAIDNKEYKYGISILSKKIVGEFLQTKFGRKITDIFTRTENKITLIDELAKFLPKEQASKVSAEMPLLAFIRKFYDYSPINDVVNSFLKTFYIDYNNPFQEHLLLKNILTIEKSKEVKETKTQILNMLSAMDIKIDDYCIEEIPTLNPNEKNLMVNVTHKIGELKYTLPLTAESSGIQKLFTLTPIIISSLTNGCPLIIDDLSAKIHPKLLEYIINLYRNKETNPNRVQLIFTSNELTTMNNIVFRRDEIYFMELKSNQEADLFSLVEIRAENGKMISKNSEYNKQYLHGRYGAGPDLRKKTD
jgi:AAA15 family ATPase/GTPase